MGNGYTQQEWIDKANTIHKDTYSYDNVIYTRSDNRVLITCKIHGDFSQLPYIHLHGRGCSKCGKIRSSKLRQPTTEQALLEMNTKHQYKYTYPNFEYRGHQKPIEAVCRDHGKFTPLWFNHTKQGHGCPLCYRTPTTTESFVEEARKVHGDDYDYSKSVYKNARTKMIIICDKHGEFKQTSNAHVSGGAGCPICSMSKGERKIRNYLINNNYHFTTQKTFKDCKHESLLKFDFFVNGVCIEYQGEQHYRSVDIWGGDEIFKLNQLRDQIKRDFCVAHSIPLLEIRFDDNEWEYKLDNILGDCLIENGSQHDLSYVVRSYQPCLNKDKLLIINT